MGRIPLVVVLLVLSFLGIADAWYLADSAATGAPLVCNIQGLDGCNTVAQSAYSRLFGIPLGVYGVLFYGLMLTLAAGALTLRMRDIPLFLLIVSALGSLASIAFLGIQVFLIKAVCVYCIASAVITFASLGFSWMLFALRKDAHPVPAPVVSEP